MVQKRESSVHWRGIEKWKRPTATAHQMLLRTDGGAFFLLSVKAPSLAAPHWPIRVSSACEYLQI